MNLKNCKEEQIFLNQCLVHMNDDLRKISREISIRSDDSFDRIYSI
mgnify:CR=1 FL=1|jgi:hypothetical protein